MSCSFSPKLFDLSRNNKRNIFNVQHLVFAHRLLIKYRSTLKQTRGNFFVSSPEEADEIWQARRPTIMYTVLTVWCDTYFCSTSVSSTCEETKPSITREAVDFMAALDGIHSRDRFICSSIPMRSHCFSRFSPIDVFALDELIQYRSSFSFLWSNEQITPKYRSLSHEWVNGKNSVRQDFFRRAKDVQSWNSSFTRGK